MRKATRKKLAIVLMLVFIISVLAGCANSDKEVNNIDKQTEENNTNTDINTGSDSQGTQSNPDDTETASENTDTDIDYLELLKQGEIDGLEFSLGANPAELIDKIGEPDDRGWFAGSEYVNYGNISYFFNQSVFAISLNEGRKFYGIELGATTVEEVKQILGEATKEFQDTMIDEDEFSTNDWKLIYDTGKYRLEFFSINAQSPVDTAYITENF